MGHKSMGRLILASCTVTLLAVSCAGTTEPGTTTATTTTAMVEETTTSEVAETTTTLAPDAVPPEMSGVWRTDLETGDPVMDNVSLNLSANRYLINRGPNSAVGSISVEGDMITFSDASVCDGTGIYQWAIEGDTLSLTMVDPADQCSGRSQVLDGITYRR